MEIGLMMEGFLLQKYDFQEFINKEQHRHQILTHKQMKDMYQR